MTIMYDYFQNKVPRGYTALKIAIINSEKKRIKHL